MIQDRRDTLDSYTIYELGNNNNTGDRYSIAKEGRSDEKDVISLVLSFLVLGDPAFVERMTEIDDENQLNDDEQKPTNHPWNRTILCTD